MHCHLSTLLGTSRENKMASGGGKYMSMCRFFNTPQGCRNGDGCMFQHVKDQKPICRFFGSPAGCNYGDRCHFAHVNPDGTQVPTNPSLPRSYTGQPGQVPVGRGMGFSKVPPMGRRGGPHPQGMEVHFDQGEVTERMENYGLRAHELNEMLSFGIKPWEDNAFETYFSILEQREELARQQQGYQ